MVANSTETGTLQVSATGATLSFADCGAGVVQIFTSTGRIQVFIAYNTSTSSVVTFTFSQSTGNLSYPGIVVFEVTGAATSSVVDVTAVHANATGGAAGNNNLSVGPMTTNYADLILGWFVQYNGALSAGTTPVTWTSISEVGGQAEYYAQSSAGSITAYANDNYSSDPYGAIALALKPSGSGGANWLTSGYWRNNPYGN
jgi:hypothetical protein